MAWVTAACTIVDLTTCRDSCGGGDGGDHGSSGVHVAAAGEQQSQEAGTV